MSTIFSKIIAGEIPSYKVYEDEYVYAFLDIFPQHIGHTLVVPKIEVDHFADLGEPYYSSIFRVAKMLAPAIQKATQCQRVCASFIGYEIPHVHYHLVPTNTIADAQFRSVPQAEPDTLEAMQKAIVAAIIIP